MQRYFKALADANLCKVIEEIKLKTAILMRVCKAHMWSKTINASWSTILWSTILWTKNNALYLQKIKNYGQTICIRDRRLWRELYR